MSANTNRYIVGIKRFLELCGNQNVNELKSAVEDAQEKVDLALTFGKFAQNESQVFSKLRKANDGLGDIGKALAKVEDVCLDADAIVKIFEAIDTLSAHNNNVIYSDPQKAAESFDMLFQGFGRLCRFLPPPAKQWGEFFEQFDLFGNVNKYIYQPYFDRQRAILKEIDAQGR